MYIEHTDCERCVCVLCIRDCRFLSVKKRFMAELKEYRGKELTPLASRSAVSLLMGLKFFRVKVNIY